jgi:uncharacterized protein YciI
VYLMISQYLKPLAEVEVHRADHQAYLDTLEQRGVLVSSGRKNPPTGGVILFAVDTAEEAEALVADDPYVKAGVAHYEPTGWEPTRGPLANWKPGA